MTTSGDLKERLPLAAAFLDRPPHHFIDGQAAPAALGQELEVINPATEEVVGHIAAGSAEDVDAAVAAAGRALKDPAWAGIDPHERSRLLYAVADALEANTTRDRRDRLCGHWHAIVVRKGVHG